MTQLSNLQNTHRPKKKIKRVGRGPGSKRGKTSCRGEKGDKSRSGYKRRYGKEGGQLPLFKKLPTRGFTRGRFKEESHTINFDRINSLFEDGDTVSPQTLKEKGVISNKAAGTLKLLAKGELAKKVLIEVHTLSKQARKKLESNSIEYKIIPLSAK